MDMLAGPGYWLARLVFERALAAIYVVAFLTAANQFRALLGSDGLLPIPRYVQRTGFRRQPSIFHLYYSDAFYSAVAWFGAALSFAILIGLADVSPLWAGMLEWLVLWLLYLSIVNVGQLWYSFGWESLLLEAGFLAVFLGPGHVRPPIIVMWLLRWLLFRLEFGAGLIKIRGDHCWRDLTALFYHHETQPMPGPLSWYFHHLPKWLHRAEVLANHATQLLVPFVLFTPQPVAGWAAIVIILTQCWLLVSGNFAWLNALTIVLALSALDSHQIHLVLPISAPSMSPAPTWYAATVLALGVVMVVLAWWPIRNMLSRHQIMNTNFNRIHLGNTYGAFGTIERRRYEVVVAGTSDERPSATSDWREYEFTGKPGDPRRRPAQIAPYHLRLDWLMWFAGISPVYAQPWLERFAEKLLRNDHDLIRLLRHNPFPDEPPAFVRADLYLYRFTTRAERRASRAWWQRTGVAEFLPPVALTRPSAPADGRRAAE